MIDDVNPNVLWSQIFVNELIKSGLNEVVVAPGSRSTALVLAFTKCKVEMYSIIDERSAGFFALGIAKSKQKPVAIVCTSGTAIANLFPAVMEAFESHSSLLLLTADRPAELRESGANQTMDQIKFFGDKVKWFIDMKTPSSDFHEKTIRYLRTTACRAYNLASSHPKGVIHINFPFNKPLEPTEREELSKIKSIATSKELFARKDDEPYTRFYTGKMHLSEEELDSLFEFLSSKKNGMIIVGQLNHNTEKFGKLIHELSQIMGYPIFADPLSQLRFSENGMSRIIGGYESFFQSQRIRNKINPEIIIQFGKSPTSKYLLLFLEEKSLCPKILFSSNGRWEDEMHTLCKVVIIDIENTLEQLNKKLKTSRKDAREHLPLSFVESIEKKYWDYVKLYFEKSNKNIDILLYVNLFAWLPDDTIVFLANSLPVRHVDQFGEPNDKKLVLFGNRGVSGIDGNISTFAGIQKNLKRGSILLIGDIAFLHDINSLLTIVKYKFNVKIILLNNSGGGIFTRLPVRQFKSEFEEYFLTPQQTDFSAIQPIFGINYIRITEMRKLEKTLTQELKISRPTVIEIQTNAQKDNEFRIEFISAMTQELEKSLEK